MLAMALAVTTMWRVSGFVTVGPRRMAEVCQGGDGKRDVHVARDALRVDEAEHLEARASRPAAPAARSADVLRQQAQAEARHYRHRSFRYRTVNRSLAISSVET